MLLDLYAVENRKLQNGAWKGISLPLSLLSLGDFDDVLKRAFDVGLEKVRRVDQRSHVNIEVITLYFFAFEDHRHWRKPDRQQGSPHCGSH